MMKSPRSAILALLILMPLSLVSGCGDDDPAGPGDPVDSTAPATVNDLTIDSVDGTNVTVAWTAPGDDGDEGTAAEYFLRISSAPISDLTWATDVAVSGTPDPAAPGTRQTAVIDATGMDEVYAALKSADEVPNLSGLSNVAHVSLSTPFVIHQLTTTDENSEPCVNDGVITWVRNRGIDGHEIYMRDLGNTIGVNTRVTGNGGQKRGPSNVGSSWVVWAGRETPEEDWEIFFDDMSGDLTPTQHTDNEVPDTDPAATVSGSFVWVQGPALFDVIKRYSSGSHEETTISEVSCPVADYSNGAPTTDFGEVVWRAFHRGNFEHKVTRYDGETGLSFDLTDDVNANTAVQLSLDDGDLAYKSGSDGVTYWDGTTATPIAQGETPSLNNGRVAYVVWDGDYEIHYWDGSTIHEITDNDFHDSQPSLFGDLLVWAGRPGGGPWQIFYVRL